MRIALVLFGIAVVVLGGLLYRASAALHAHSARADGLYAQAKDWEQRAHQCSRESDSLRSRMQALSPSPIDESEVQHLRDKGLADPLADLADDLQRHPELIRYAGHGRGMRFYDRDRIRVLGERWVYAPFEDGHNGGEAILEYGVATSGRISWRVLHSRLWD